MHEQIITDGDNHITLDEAVIIIDRARSTIQDWYNKGATSLAALKALSNDKTRSGEQLYDTCRGRMTSKQIAAISGNSPSSVYGRAKRHGWKSEVVFWPPMTREELNTRLRKEGLYIPRKKDNPSARVTYKNSLMREMHRSSHMQKSRVR